MADLSRYTSNPSPFRFFRIVIIIVLFFVVLILLLVMHIMLLVRPGTISSAVIRRSQDLNKGRFLSRQLTIAVLLLTIV